MMARADTPSIRWSFATMAAYMSESASGSRKIGAGRKRATWMARFSCTSAGRCRPLGSAQMTSARSKPRASSRLRDPRSTCRPSAQTSHSPARPRSAVADPRSRPSRRQCRRHSPPPASDTARPRTRRGRALQSWHPQPMQCASRILASASVIRCVRSPRPSHRKPCQVDMARTRAQAARTRLRRSAPGLATDGTS